MGRKRGFWLLVIFVGCWVGVWGICVIRSILESLARSFGRSGYFCCLLDYFHDLRRKSRKNVEGIGNRLSVGPGNPVNGGVINANIT